MARHAVREARCLGDRPVAVIVVDVARAIPTAAAMRRIEGGTSMLPFVRFGLDNVTWVAWR